MASQYKADQISATADIEAAGRKVKLLTPVEVSGDAHGFNRDRNTAPTAPTEEDITVVQSKFKSEMIDGVKIRMTDVLFLVPGNITISTNMKIKDGNQTYNIEDVQSVKPGDLTILFKVQCR